MEQEVSSLIEDVEYLQVWNIILSFTLCISVSDVVAAITVQKLLSCWYFQRENKPLVINRMMKPKYHLQGYDHVMRNSLAMLVFWLGGIWEETIVCIINKGFDKYNK